MSRKLGVLVLALGILAGAMELKTILKANTKGVVLSAGGSSPMPPRIKPPSGGPNN